MYVAQSFSEIYERAGKVRVLTLIKLHNELRERGETYAPYVERATKL